MTFGARANRIRRASSKRQARKRGYVLFRPKIKTGTYPLFVPGVIGQREIGREFGVGPHAVRKAIARTAALRREGGKVGRVLQRLTSTFRA